MVPLKLHNKLQTTRQIKGIKKLIKFSLKVKFVLTPDGSKEKMASLELHNEALLTKSCDVDA